jgi:hypothetical protein
MTQTQTTRTTLGITASDIEQMETIFTALEIDLNKHAFRYNRTYDCWELWEIDVSQGGTKRARCCINMTGGAWQQV